MKYESTHIILHTELDSFENGCGLGDSYDACYDHSIKADTIAEYLNELFEHTCWSEPNENAYELNSCDEPGRIDVCLMLDEHNQPANKIDLADWKSGKKELYSGTYTVYVESITREPAEL